MMTSQWSPPVVRGEAVQNLTFVHVSKQREMLWFDWTMARRWSCLVLYLTLSLSQRWYFPNRFPHTFIIHQFT